MSKLIKLPDPITKGTVSLEEAIALRRSERSYAKSPLKLEQISQILWSAQGITDRRGFRAAPSAGATYPLEIYAVVKDGGVDGLEAGVYRYIPEKHALELVKEGDYSAELMSACLDQDWVGKAPLNIVIVAIYERTTRRYGERGKRYVYMEVGHVGQNIYLQATAIGLGTVAIGAFYDDEVKKVLSLPKEEVPLYVMPIGVSLRKR